ncbi:hypothetical protein QLY92_21355, partial [Cronobacter dublinensis]|nr:hypothetical protein [Cronobacter dublinensis]
MHKTTLEQWALLDKVVEEGSFARAAALGFQQRHAETLLHQRQVIANR